MAKTVEVKMEDTTTRTCDNCGKDFHLVDFSYIGPRDPKDISCHPFMDFIYICTECWEDGFYKDYQN